MATISFVAHLVKQSRKDCTLGMLALPLLVSFPD